MLQVTYSEQRSFPEYVDMYFKEINFVTECKNPLTDWREMVDLLIGRIKKYAVLTSTNGNQWGGGCLLTIDQIWKLRDELNCFLLDNERIKELTKGK